MYNIIKQLNFQIFFISIYLSLRRIISKKKEKKINLRMYDRDHRERKEDHKGCIQA
jgi:hypothetical protein